MRRVRVIAGAAGIVAIAMLTILVLPGNRAEAQATAQMPLAGSAIPKWIDELPRFNVVDSTSGVIFNLTMKEFQFPILPAGAVPGYTGTYVWGYLDNDQRDGTKAKTSYLGPIIVARRGVPTEVNFVNELGSVATTNVLAYKHSVDQTLHWADPLNHELNAEAKKVAMGGYANGSTYPAPGDLGSLTYNGPIPAVVHLHGGEVPPVLDGGPDSWVTSVGNLSGHGYWTRGLSAQGAPATSNTFVYRYPNTQEAANSWFHDHTLGATRLNVYAGLAGGYVLLDPLVDPQTNLITNLNYPAPANLPKGRDASGTAGQEHLIPLAIQDRMFDTNGQLFFPADSAGGVLWTTNPEHPYWVPEFVGDTIVVNGKSWPTIGTAIAPLPSKRYRFLFLNGSNARTYELWLVDPVTKANGPPIWVIGTDGGYLNAPVKIDPNAAVNNKLLIMPGERYDVIIDFNDPVYRASRPSGQLILRNSGRTPYPKGGTPNGSTMGQIVKIFVGPTAAGDSSYDPNSVGPFRATPIVPLAGTTVNVTRQLTLNEVMGLARVAIDPVTGVQTAYPGGPLEVVLNNTKWNGMRFNPVSQAMEQVEEGVFPSNHPPVLTPAEYLYSELPKEGDTEVWEIINLTADAHPIHLHLAQFQILNRQNFNSGNYMKKYAAAYGGVVKEAYGPPYPYSNTTNPDFLGIPNVVGGNPNVTPFLQGPVLAPKPWEAGWKDTAVMLPGQVTRIIVRWAPTDVAAGDLVNNFYPFNPNGGHGYVWHCHIIDHEDNEMMRPVSIIPKNVDRRYVKGRDY